MRDNTVSQASSPGRRAAAYWFADGLPELVFGIAFLGWGAMGLIWRFNMQAHWLKTLMLIPAVGFMMLWLCDRKILGFFKARLTYPRTGYVAPPRDPPAQRPDELTTLATAKPVDENVTRFRLATVFLFFQAMVCVGSFNGRWSVAIFMTLVAVLLYVLNRQEAVRYPWWSVAPIALAGLFSTWLDMPLESREFLPLLIGGAWLLSRGAITLIRYLRAHPAPAAMELRHP